MLPELSKSMVPEFVNVVPPRFKVPLFVNVELALFVRVVPVPPSVSVSSEPIENMPLFWRVIVPTVADPAS